MAYKDRIVSITPEGRATIVYNGVRFYTSDKSVIAMAQRGNISGAARRYIGKSSLARELRKINKTVPKPIYQNINKALFEKVFKEKNKKTRVTIDRVSFAKFREKYKKISKEATGYMLENVKDKITATVRLDAVPEELMNDIDQTIEEEVEKAYAEKGGSVTDNVITKINDRIKEKVKDYAINADLDEEQKIRLLRLAETPEAEINNEVKNLKRY